MKIKAKAFLFDLNGTVIDDMHYHVVAWQNILNRKNIVKTELKQKYVQ